MSRPLGGGRPGRGTLLLLCLLFLHTLPAHSSPLSKIEPKLKRHLDAGAGERIKVWLLFTDRGQAGPSLDEAARLSPRAIQRRIKNGMAEALYPFDRDVYQPYIEAVRTFDVKHRTTSRWLNGITVEAPVEVVPLLAELPFVRAIRKMVSFRRDETPRAHQGPAGPGQGNVHLRLWSQPGPAQADPGDRGP